MSTAAVPRGQNVSYTAITADDYVLLSPLGEPLKVTRALYDALKMFVGSNDRPAGSITVDCNRGGIAGVEVKMRLK